MGQGKRLESSEGDLPGPAVCGLEGSGHGPADRPMLAHKLGLPTVVTHPVYYLTPEQATLQRTLAAIRLNQPLDRLPAERMPPRRARTFVSAGRDGDALPGISRPPWLPPQEIAARCKFDLPLGVAHMPTVPLPPGLTRRRTPAPEGRSGGARLYGEITPPVQERLDHELEVIARMGYRADLPDRRGDPGLRPPHGRAVFVARLGGLLAGGALPGHHQPRPAAAGPVLRALPQPGPHHPARYRHRPVLAPARRGHPARLRHLRRGTGGDGRDDQPLPAALGPGRRGQGPRAGAGSRSASWSTSCPMPSGRAFEEGRRRRGTALALCRAAPAYPSPSLPAHLRRGRSAAQAAAPPLGPSRRAWWWRPAR